jgi:signal peptidase I
MPTMTRSRARSSPERRRKLLREALTLASLVLVLLAARSSLADHNLVPSSSMLPTLQIGDRILVNKLAYGLRVPFSHQYLIASPDPARGDVVVLDSPVDGTRLVKRVVAVPGDRVEVRRGRLRLDGREVEVRPTAGGLVEVLSGRAHPLSLAAGGGPDLGPVTLPADRYLVMGDNRGNSADGRSFGSVSRARILGRVVGVFLRQGRFTWISL